MIDRSELPYLLDSFEAELALSHSHATRRAYMWTLGKFADQHPGIELVELASRRTWTTFLGRWRELTPSTKAARIAACAAFTAYLKREGIIPVDPMLDVPRPKRIPADKLDVPAISTAELRSLFDHVTSWAECAALFLVVYTGARRGAAARVRWGDVELDERREITFREKGGQTHRKPLPDELAAFLRAARDSGVIDTSPNAYIIPNLMPERVQRAERDDRIVWTLIRRIAKRAGIRDERGRGPAVHALRAAFATYYLEEHGGQIDELKELLGHKRIETTEVYLRRLDRARRMERVRGLSFGFGAPFVLPANVEEAHTGFEPVLSANAEDEPSPRNVKVTHVESLALRSIRKLTPWLDAELARVGGRS